MTAQCDTASQVRRDLRDHCVEPYYSRTLGEDADKVRIVPYRTRWFPRRPWTVVGPRASALAVAGVVWALAGTLVALMVSAALTEDGIGIVNGLPRVLPGAPASTVQLVASLVCPALLGAMAMIAQGAAVAAGLAREFVDEATPRGIVRALNGRAPHLIPVALSAGVAVLGGQLGIWYAVDPYSGSRDFLGVSASLIIPLALVTYLSWLIPVALAEDVGPLQLWRRGALTLVRLRPRATFTPLLVGAGLPLGFIAWLMFEAAVRWSRQYSGTSFLLIAAALTLAAALVTCWSGTLTARLYLARQPFVGRTVAQTVETVLPRLPATIATVQGRATPRPRAGTWARAGVGSVATVIPAAVLGVIMALNPTGLVEVTGSQMGYPSRAESAEVSGGLTALPVGYGDIALTGGRVAVLDSGARGTGFFSPKGTAYGDAVITFSCDGQAGSCPPATEPQPYTLLGGASMAAAGGSMVALTGWATTASTEGITTEPTSCTPYDCRAPGDHQRIDRLVFLVCEPNQCGQLLAAGKAMEVGPTTNTQALDWRYGQVETAVVALGQGQFAVMGWRPRPDAVGQHAAGSQATLSVCRATGCDQPRKIGEQGEVFTLASAHGLPIPIAYNTSTGAIDALMCDTDACDSPSRRHLFDGYAFLPQREDAQRDWPSYRLGSAVVRTDGGLAVSYTDPVSLHQMVAWCSDETCAQVEQRTLSAATVAQQPVRLAPGPGGVVAYTITDPTSGALQMGVCDARGCAEGARVTLGYFADHQVMTYRDLVVGPASVSLQVQADGRPVVSWAGAPRHNPAAQVSGLTTCPKPWCGLIP